MIKICHGEKEKVLRSLCVASFRHERYGGSGVSVVNDLQYLHIGSPFHLHFLLPILALYLSYIHARSDQ